jgi:AIPR protein
MTDEATTHSLEALAARDDLKIYAGNELLLFALELGLALDDVLSVAATALTDGPNDKKCDLVYVDEDSGRAVIAQGYQSTDLTKTEAPANKASDLNTAVAWLLSGDPSELPEGLKAAGEELDSALKNGSITSLDIWYVHNLPASKNVQEELDKVQATADALLARNYPEIKVDSLVVLEVDRSRLEGLYQSTRVSILVTDEMQIPVTGGFEESGDRWTAFCTSVPARWLREVFEAHKTALFAANVRDYLGSRRSDRNINNNIKETAKNAPTRFWAYNNGLTALVNDYSPPAEWGPDSVVTIKGLSVVNGAQTTGALASVEVIEEADLDGARVLARFVKCSDQDVVRDIIQYTNSQNRVEAADFRSGDATQERLRREFDDIPDAVYRGGRRGSETDQIERTPNVIPSSTAAQSLMAFHGEPSTAYYAKSRIWEEDNIYARVFSDRTTARHMVLVFSLLRCVEEAKRQLLAIPEDARTQPQQRQVEFFRKRGSVYLLMAAIASSMETYLDRAVPDSFALRFKENYSPIQGIAAWAPIVQSALPFAEHLEPALDKGLSSDKAVEAIRTFGGLVEATKAVNAEVFNAFAEQVE